MTREAARSFGRNRGRGVSSKKSGGRRTLAARREADRPRSRFYELSKLDSVTTYCVCGSVPPVAEMLTLIFQRSFTFTLGFSLLFLSAVARLLHCWALSFLPEVCGRFDGRCIVLHVVFFPARLVFLCAVSESVSCLRVGWQAKCLLPALKLDEFSRGMPGQFCAVHAGGTELIFCVFCSRS